jgi:hypothetical protein
MRSAPVGSGVGAYDLQQQKLGKRAGSYAVLRALAAAHWRPVSLDEAHPKHTGVAVGIAGYAAFVVEYHCRAFGLRVRGRGLVVLTSYSHRGVVNAVKQSQAVSGEKKIHAVIGGFHLARTRRTTSATP